MGVAFAAAPWAAARNQIHKSQSEVADMHFQSGCTLTASKESVRGHLNGPEAVKQAQLGLDGVVFRCIWTARV